MNPAKDMMRVFQNSAGKDSIICKRIMSKQGFIFNLYKIHSFIVCSFILLTLVNDERLNLPVLDNMSLGCIVRFSLRWVKPKNLSLFWNPEQPS